MDGAELRAQLRASEERNAELRRELISRCAEQEAQRSELTLTNEATGPSGEKLPPLPAAMSDPKRMPIDRLLAGLEYAQSLIEPRKGQRYIWGMGPMAIKDPQGYLELLARLPPQAEIASWMRGADFDGTLSGYFNPRLTEAERTRAQIEGWILGVL